MTVMVRLRLPVGGGRKSRDSAESNLLQGSIQKVRSDFRICQDIWISVTRAPPSHQLVEEGTTLPLLGDLITIIRYQNSACKGISGDEGICLSDANDCERRKGTNIGTCARGLSTCCLCE
ncbi:CUB domain-containing protein [Caerostris extrusa]|uniref:CUB domain-containing protein n=1 Tax=Caerostris extrusa TaxID=172846 RepID=A0AAV4XWP5_CAEEX|nr:CUB domain-containing protein [Caerostris extrusa]